ncbi:MAG: class II fumarate hydratase [Eubacteriaceae bacterium]|nr:class II fumarate hydratase [Eubacteriaceae bacterium]
MEFRIEHDSMGEVKVPTSALWGAQTQRSLENFPIGEEKMPLIMVYTITEIKRAAAQANADQGVLSTEKASAIVNACLEILDGKHDSMFPLTVWQTGSGTQTNMNVNEVIANIANASLGGQLVHPNDDVNKSQSTNDVFPTAMHVSIIKSMIKLLIDLSSLISIFESLAEEYMGLAKTGRTHLQDAAPITLGQEIGGWASALSSCRGMLFASIDILRNVPLGGTAVGTGLNTKEGFDKLAVEYLSDNIGIELHPMNNKFAGLASKCEAAQAHSAMKNLAGELLRIANDIRLLSSGPMSGIGEIVLPENEPGSSIMPGKVNPTQAEALAMACVHVIGNDAAVSMGACLGSFQLNVMMPMIIYNALQSASLLSDAISSFALRCASGIKPNYSRIQDNLDRNLMLATALAPVIGYENTAIVAKKALDEGISLKQAALSMGFVGSSEFDAIMKVDQMLSPSDGH